MIGSFATSGEKGRLGSQAWTTAGWLRFSTTQNVKPVGVVLHTTVPDDPVTHCEGMVVIRELGGSHREDVAFPAKTVQVSWWLEWSKASQVTGSGPMSLQ
ncbi:hypothetical protein N7468_002283 [Penicillium chermesinum]|uniref:Uncharacterized protein n=1 Tax=Penicillium chermesinum TaxID=63820 RepID=A0A9W9TXH0_9EURO|nr:uncharacterized protein N7468_002283 [Penicillium chermesinum]KAJ5247300.1 hypothetical protein N7468_002283 [Penicillium chermesinum]KAJ6145544.1 hypothetical protein N7470_009439 [Penicillium chermesinum]